MARSLWRCSDKVAWATAWAAVMLAPVPTVRAATIGGESGAYLRAPAGAEAMAMGGAFTASPASMRTWWNPSACAGQKFRHLAAGFGIRSLGRTEAFGSFEFLVPPRAGMGIALLYRGDPFLDNLWDEVDGVKVHIGAARFTSITGKLGFGYTLTPRFALGAAIAVYYQSLPTGVTDTYEPTYSSATGIGGFDLAARYDIADVWTISLVGRNVAAGMKWDIESADGYFATIDDRPLPQLVLASRMETALMAAPLIWTCDLNGYLFDGNFGRLPHPQAVLDNGLEWQRWKGFWPRVGLGDIGFDGTLFSDSRGYWRSFGFRLALGFAVDLSVVTRGLRVNYACSTDKVWAGVDNALDLTYSF